MRYRLGTTGTPKIAFQGTPLAAVSPPSPPPPPPLPPAGSTVLDFTGGTLPAGTSFKGGLHASYYDAQNILHPDNPADHPRFDHNPVNGASLGLLDEPPIGNYWASSNMTAANTNSSDNSHASVFSMPPAGAGVCATGTGSNTTVGWAGVYGITTQAQGVGPGQCDQQRWQLPRRHQQLSGRR